MYGGAEGGVAGGVFHRRGPRGEAVGICCPRSRPLARGSVTENRLNGPPRPATGAVYSFTKYHNSWSGSPINYLDERLPDIFMEIAYEPYWKYFGDRLGKTLVGAFRDNEGAYGCKLAWSESLARRYQKDKGQDIRQMMPLLIDQDPAGQSAKARWDWFDCVSNIYADSYWQIEHRLACVSTDCIAWGIPGKKP